MNLALSDEQEFLREAARGSLARVATVAAAREALEQGAAALPDLWPVAQEAGWTGLLIDEEHGGAELDAFDAMLVLGECGRVLAGVALLGHLPATSLLGAAGAADELPGLASGETRGCYLPACPPSDIERHWTVDPEGGAGRSPLPAASATADGLSVTGRLHWVPDAPGADVYVGVADLDGQPVGFAALAADVRVTELAGYDATRGLGHVELDGAKARRLDADAAELADAWYLAQTLVAAESVGAIETALDTSVAYAKERNTFGRAIGSYQAVKHSLTEVLRQLELSRSLLYYAGWAREGKPEEFPIAASAARSMASRALDTAARTMIAVHGGIGATWEHDAPLYFRRAQLTHRLIGGTALATDRVAGVLIEQAA